MKLLKILLILISIFSISIYIRAPYIEKEVQPNNETSIIMLTVLENWQSKGISNFYFAPVITWQNNADKYMANYKRLEDNRGNNYYVSYPPLAFIFPYLISSIFNLVPTQILLQIINIIIHFVSSLLVYLIICEYFKFNPLNSPIIALVGYISYTFMPVLLYVHTFNFFSEMMGQFFFIIGIYLFQLIQQEENIINKKLPFLFGINLFIIIYTEWIGIFYSFSLLLLLLLKYRKNIFKNSLFRIMLVISSISLIFVIFQYSCINGFSNLTRSLGLRFLERSGFFGQNYSDMKICYTNKESYLLLFQQAHQTLIGFGYVALTLLIIYIIKFKIKIKHLIKANQLLFLIIFPIILSFLTFFNATVIHYNWWAKFGIIISLLISLIFNKLMYLPKFTNNKSVYKIIIICITLFAVIISSIEFKKQADKMQYNNNNLKFIGNVIIKNSGIEESIFLNLSKELTYYNTYLSYITKRNIVNVTDFEDAKKNLKEKNKAKGVFYTFEKQINKYSVIHFTQNN